MSTKEARALYRYVCEACAATPEGPCTWPLIWGRCMGTDNGEGHRHDPQDVDPRVCPCGGCKEWRNGPDYFGTEDE